MNNQPITCAIYLRVSTQDQSTAMQRVELEQYAKTRGWEIAATFEDKATGTNDKRPMLKQVMEGARQRKFDIVLVWKLDRWARSLKDLVTTLQELTDLGIQFVSLKDQIDMTTASGRLMLHIIAAFAEFEAAIIKERVRAGIKNAKSKGQRLGRPLTIDPFKVIAMRQHGMSLSAIAKELGVTKSAVSKTLSKMALKKRLNKNGIIEECEQDQKVE